MRWAMVASGTRNALAISAVVSPPTADLGRRQPADGAQRERDRRRRRQRRMAAHEEHDQRVVPIGDLGCRRLLPRREPLPVSPRLLAPPLVDQPPRRGLDEPPARMLRDSVSRPVPGRREQGLLDGVLGGGEVAGAAGQQAEDLRRQLAQQVLDVGGHVQPSPPAVCRNASISATSAGARSIT
jgi:hypothetical protein